MKTSKYIPAYILCGGKSSRMKRDKGLVTFDGMTFTGLIIKTLRNVTDEIYLVTANEKYREFGLPLIADQFENKGPLGGIHAALDHTESTRVLILSCDVPLITSTVLTEILMSVDVNPDYQIHFAIDDAKWHPLIGCYSKSLVKKAEVALQANQLKLMDFVKNQDYQEVAIADSKSLKNINTPEALAQAEMNL